MDIDLSFIKNDYFLNTLKEYLERLFESEKKIKSEKDDKTNEFKIRGGFNQRI